MKLLKKSLALVTALSVSAVALLSGCGSQTESSSEPSQTETTTVASTEAATKSASSSDYTGKISPLLYKAEGKNGNTMYLFGTIHIGDSRNDIIVNDLSDELQSCDAIAVEFDSVEFSENLDEQLAVMSTLLLSDGTTTKDHFRKDLYEKCVKYMTEAGVYDEMYDTYCPGFWYMTLSQAAVKKSDYSGDYGVDGMLTKKAYEFKKEILEFESAKFQMESFRNLSDELVNLLTEAFFKTEADYNSNLSKLYNAWTVGDEAEIQKMLDGENVSQNNEELTAEQKKLVEEYQNALTHDRNKKMGEKAVSYIDSGKNVFVAVGTAHIIGDTGIVKYLKDKGYKVEKVDI